MTFPAYDPDEILADPHALPIHKAYAAINIGIRDRGEVWEKCANCGDPYLHTPEWSRGTVCSERCADEFRAYLNDPEAGYR